MPPRWHRRRAWFVPALLSALPWAASGCGEPPAPRFTEARLLGGQTVEADVLNRGAEVFRLRCATCHGHEGGGDGPGARGMRNPPTNFREGRFRLTAPAGGLPSDEALDSVIRNGRVDEGMPPWPGLLPEDRHALVQYLKTFSDRWRAPEEAP